MNSVRKMGRPHRDDSLNGPDWEIWLQARCGGPVAELNSLVWPPLARSLRSLGLPW